MIPNFRTLREMNVNKSRNIGASAQKKKNAYLTEIMMMLVKSDAKKKCTTAWYDMLKFCEAFWFSLIEL